MKIGIIGTGYVGLVSGVCFASNGNSVTCVDTNPAIVDKLARGEVTIYEPGLEGLLQQTIKDKRISFTTDVKGTVQKNDMLFIAVGTPMNQDRSADLSAIKTVATDIGRYANGHKIVVTKSTVPVGTGDQIEKIVQMHTLFPIDVVSNPEFLKEGSAVEDFMKPDRVIVGSNPGSSSDAIEQAFSTLYRPFTMNGSGILFTNRTTAELIKYAGNTMLASRISLMNEVSRLADACGADIDAVRRGIGLDKRIGPAFLYASAGYGGSCFPKDILALAATGREYGLHMPLVNAISQTNDLQKEWFVDKILSHYNNDVARKTIGMWGLAFKAKTDDVRLSPALHVAQQLTQRGARVIAYDPKARDTARTVLGDSISYAPSQYDCFPADALVIMTDWNEFKAPDFGALRLHDSVIFDARNLYDLASMREQPFKYISVGRPSISGPSQD
ncbi:MAG TPA: UDP-glucose/GDP-mannose dehydrogenase family protein [Acidobacteriota bacterium]|nr:UDP-glucose/GDP-mannose dehydrogenase family protein [Acidobacteriota bacterium]